MRRCVQLWFPIVLLSTIACSGEQDLVDPGLTLADVRLGKQAFEASCSGCHASADGFDLKMFGFGDTTIIRRAVHHVDTLTARKIVAYIQTLEVPSKGEDFRLFQPGGAVVGTDEEFAYSLFGRDAWPDNMSTEQLTAIDPRTVKIAIQLPVWSDEASNLDWMPDFAPTAAVLDHNESGPRKALAAYRAEPTSENLIRAVTSLRAADRTTSNPVAPCRATATMNVQDRECFEVRRWTSTLVALHMLRYGPSDLGGKVHDVWWDAGNAARKSLVEGRGPIANADKNWAAWMFLGWTFDPTLHPSFYLARVLGQLGLGRHATFLAARSLVARPKNSVDMYEDLTTAARYAPPSWAVPVVEFGLRHIDERHLAGERPNTASQRAAAIKAVNLAITHAGEKIPVAEKIRLQNLAEPAVAALQ